MQYRILIVDDSDFSRSTIANMLTDEKYNVIGEAASAKEAINILRDRKAHLVIIDIVMPEVSGIELAEYITENFQNTSIIMISSLAQESIVIDSISVFPICFSHIGLRSRSTMYCDPFNSHIVGNFYNFISVD